MSYRLGVDMGGTGIKAGVIDENNNIIAKVYVPTEAGFENVVKAIADAARSAAEKAGTSIEDYPCVGVGTPSCINPNTGRLVFSNNTNWRDVPLREELEKYIPVPVYIGNDANCAIIGENIAGAAKGKKNVVMLTLGTGVGGGVIYNGKLFCGGDGMGGELGHAPIQHNGYLCTCGINGCLEAYASVTGLIRMAKEAMEKHPDSLMHEHVKNNGPVSGITVFECAKAGDRTALEVVDTYEEYLANGIGGYINIFRPDVFLIGGGLSNAGDFLLNALREKVKKYVFASDIIGVPPIERATLGNDAGIIGAGNLDLL